MAQKVKYLFYKNGDLGSMHLHKKTFGFSH